MCRQKPTAPHKKLSVFPSDLTDDIKENKDINQKNEKNNKYGLDDNDELLKKIAEIEGSN